MNETSQDKLEDLLEAKENELQLKINEFQINKRKEESNMWKDLHEADNDYILALGQETEEEVGNIWEKKQKIETDYKSRIQKLEDDFNNNEFIIKLKEAIEEIKNILPENALYFFSMEYKVFVKLFFKKEIKLLDFVSRFTKEFGMSITFNTVDQDGRAYTINDITSRYPEINPQALMLLNKLSPGLEVTKSEERINGLKDFSNPEIQQVLLIEFNKASQKQ